MEKPRVKRGQVYKSKYSPLLVEIFKKHGARWKARVLTTKSKVYNGSHTLSEYSLKSKFRLVDDNTNK